jgi:hypothetical protein
VTRRMIIIKVLNGFPDLAKKAYYMVAIVLLFLDPCKCPIISILASSPDKYLIAY